MQVCGKTCHHFMMSCLKTLADLRETDEFPYENEVEQVFGSAIESIGPEIIIKEIPLQVSIYFSNLISLFYKMKFFIEINVTLLLHIGSRES